MFAFSTKDVDSIFACRIGLCSHCVEKILSSFSTKDVGSMFAVMKKTHGDRGGGGDWRSLHHRQ